MRTNTTRMRLVLLAACGILAACALIVAQSPAPIAHFTATSAAVSGAGDAIRIEVLKWSTDADRDQLLNVWTHPNTPPPAPAVTAAPAGAGAGANGAAAAGGGRGGRGGAGGGAGGGGAAAAGGAQGAGRGGAGGAAGAGRGAAGAAGAAAAGGAPPLPAAADNAGGDAAAAVAAAGAGGAGGGGRGGGGRGGRGGGGGGAAAADATPETPENALAAALQRRDTVAIMWTSEAAGYSLKFAYRIPMPDGGERIIFVTDRRLGLWSDQYWKPAAPATPTNLPFTVVELRMTAKGDGEGRTSLTGKVAEEAAIKSIALENYSALPVMLKSVKSVK